MAEDAKKIKPIKKRNEIRDIALMAMLTAVLFVQEQILSFLPQVQLTVLLIILYTKILGSDKTAVMVTVHVLLDNIVNGSLLFTPFMLLGWLQIPYLLTTVFKKAEKPLTLALLSILFSLFYSWSFIIPSIMLYEMTFKEYLALDIAFEVPLALVSFITVLWLYPPLSKALLLLNQKTNDER